MADFAHDKLRALHPIESTWPSVRLQLLSDLNDPSLILNDDYYPSLSSLVSPDAVIEWKEIQPGSCTLEQRVFDLLRTLPVRPRRRSSCAARGTVPSPALHQCMLNLCATGVIAPCAPRLPTMSLFMKPKDTFTARIICDLRPLNRQYPVHPPRFPLPSVSLLMQLTVAWPSVFFTKLDVTAYFHSLIIKDVHLRGLVPPDLHSHPFIFTVQGTSWKWLRLPFGWAWSPILAQLQMTLFVSDTNPSAFGVLVLVYYDDVLLAGPSAEAVRLSTSQLMDHLRSKGLLLSDRKCCATPSSRIDWLGKSLSHHKVHNLPCRTRQLAVALRRLSSPSTRGLQRVLGWTLWYIGHLPGASRTLTPLFRRLHQHPAHQLSWYELWSYALAMSFGSLVYTKPSSGAPTTVLASDACADLRQIGVCSSKEGVTALVPSDLLAGYVEAHDAQQTCELYGVVVALLTGSQLASSVEVLTDSSCCYFWFHNQRFPTTPIQAQLLLAATTLLLLRRTLFAVSWIPGTANPADPWSRAPL